MKQYVMLFLLLAVVACGKKEAAADAPVKTKDSSSCTKESAGKKKFQMYEMSEMAALMEKMFQKNMELKERIEKGEKIGQFDSDFLRIHKAQMTDGKDNDAFFQAQAAAFIKSQQLIYEDPSNAKEHFNNSVNTCISCHQQKCGGPIPRIKKLLIE